MRARFTALFFITVAMAISSPSFAFAAHTIISKNSGIAEPYTAWVGGNLVVNDPRFFVASGTVTSIAFPAAVYRRPLVGTETFQLKLYNYYSSFLYDCATPVKTMDEWGITHTPRDPYAPMVTFGPFTGKGCTITKSANDGADEIMVWPIRDGQFECTDYPGMMGANYKANFTVYGVDVPDPPTAPTLVLNGATTTTAEFGETYTDLGATASDTVDGDLTSSIIMTGAVDTNSMGTTTLTYVVTNSSGLSATTTRDVLVACTHNCYSSVLFLPGIEGSRLYEGTGCGKNTEEKLWEPIGESILKILRGAGDDKARELFLDTNGESACDDIYAKTDDVIDSAGGDIYKSFIAQMNGLKNDGTINDWKAAAYDWRLSLDDLLDKGVEREGKIFYSEATSTPYIEQTLRALAARSRTGKVTIVAHSNGGLLAKALLNKLGGEAATSLVDKLVMVGAPQSGAPLGVGALLYGHDQGITFWGVPILHSDIAQKLALNSPMAYHLLPSQNYFDSVMDDAEHPVARFEGDGYESEIAAYSNAIGTVSELDGFLRDSSLNSSLIDYANMTHNVLDGWMPPEGITVSQIAGWGVDTVAGIDFYTPMLADAITALAPVRAYRPIFTEDGDGTVPVPSALLMAENTGVKRFWINLYDFNRDQSVNRKHEDLFEIPQLQDFIKNIITSSTSSLPTYISANQPATENASKKLTFFLHSPLTLQLTDSSGNVTGLAEDNSITQDIPGSTYGEFGEVKYITVPEGSAYQLSMHGQASGTFSLDIQETSDGTITNTSTIANVPTTPNTLASLLITEGMDTASALTVDENGDGKNIITLKPEVGETVSYEAPPPPPEVVEDTKSVAPAITLIKPVGSISISATAVPIKITGLVPAPIPMRVAITPKATPTQAPAPIMKKEVATEVQKAGKEAMLAPQPAAAYSAVSQQPFFAWLGKVIYNGWQGFWAMLKRFF